MNMAYGEFDGAYQEVVVNWRLYTNLFGGVK